MTPYDDHDLPADAPCDTCGDPDAGHRFPPLRPPHEMDPVRTQADLHRLWRSLMGELGFSRTSLWFTVLEPDGQPTPALVAIDDLPAPEPGHAAALVDLCRQVIEDVAPGGSVAFLHTGPGTRTAVTEVERRWAADLWAAVASAGLPGWPVHVANDRRLVVVSPDDLAAAG